MKRFILMAALLLMPLHALAEIIVEDAWVRLPPPVADTAAGYMTIKNSGDKDVELTGIKTAIATDPEFHSMEMHDGMMHMQKMEKVIIPAGSGITFNPGGNHLMLIGLTGPLKAGSHVMMSLTTADGSSIMVHAEVRDMRGSSDHSSHNMSNDTSDDTKHSDHGSHDMHGDMHH